VSRLAAMWLAKLSVGYWHSGCISEPHSSYFSTLASLQIPLTSRRAHLFCVAMSYAQLGDDRASPRVENIELTTKHNNQAGYAYAPPSSLPPDRDAQYSDSTALLPPSKTTIGKWPVESQQVAALTPLRGTILAFDIVLASAPLLFIDECLSVDHRMSH
jgi:hypothetical protein